MVAGIHCCRASRCRVAPEANGADADGPDASEVGAGAEVSRTGNLPHCVGGGRRRRVEDRGHSFYGTSSTGDDVVNRAAPVDTEQSCRRPSCRAQLASKDRRLERSCGEGLELLLPTAGRDNLPHRAQAVKGFDHKGWARIEAIDGFPRPSGRLQLIPTLPAGECQRPIHGQQRT